MFFNINTIKMPLFRKNSIKETFLKIFKSNKTYINSEESNNNNLINYEGYNNSKNHNVYNVPDPSGEIVAIKISPQNCDLKTIIPSSPVVMKSFEKPQAIKNAINCQNSKSDNILDNILLEFDDIAKRIDFILNDEIDNLKNEDYETTLLGN